MARFIPLVVVALLVFTEPGQRIWTSAADWASERAAEWFTNALEEKEQRRELQERLASIDPMCDSDMRPDGFQVSEGQAIALVAGKRKVSCDEVETEILNDTWSVHIGSTERHRCEINGVVHGSTGEVANRRRSCG